MDHRVQMVIDIMERDIARHVDWNRMVSVIRVSPSWLRTLFKESTGMSPSAFLKQRRLERARDLLRERTWSVKEIMATVGFSDESHFVRDFERLYGESPKQYRRRVIADEVELAIRPTN